MNNKTCPRCGYPFSCTMDIECWCMVTDIPEIVKKHMANHYKDCLCSDCIYELKNKLVNQNKDYE